MNEIDLNTEDIAILKQKLEVEKLYKEIETITLNNVQLKNEWYKKPQWIAAISPIIIGILTLIVAWSSGFLQAQSTLNKIQQETFNNTKDSISKASSQAIFLAKENASYDSANKRMKILLTVLNDSLKNNAQKRIFFSDKLIYLQNENLKLQRRIAVISASWYLRMPYFSIADSSLRISDADIQEYLRKNKDSIILK